VLLGSRYSLLTTLFWFLPSSLLATIYSLLISSLLVTRYYLLTTFISSLASRCSLLATISMPFLLEFLTPEKIILSEPVESVIAPGIEGYFGVLPRHTYFVTPLAAGVVKIKKDGLISLYEISGGVCEVTPAKVIILASTAVLKTGSS